MNHHKIDTVIEVVKAAPPVSALGLTIFGYPINEVVLLLTGLYTVILIIDKAPTVLTRLRSLWHWVQEKRL